MSKPFQVMPPLTAAEYEALKADIAEHGVRYPIVVDQIGRIVDGHHRKQIADELGINYEHQILVGRTDEELLDEAVRLNINRRHLTVQQRREIIGKLRAGGKSVRDIAATTGIPKSTVDRDLSTVPSGTVPEKITGRDGRQQPATRPISPKVANIRDYFADEQEQHDVMEMGDASDEEFEAALAAARDDGDLSRENVVGHLPAVQQRTPRRKPLPDQFWKAAFELQKAVERLERLTADDRFPANRDVIVERNHRDVRRAAEALARVQERLGDPGE